MHENLDVYLLYRLDWAKHHLFFGETCNIIPLSLFTAAFRWQLSDDFIEFDDEEVRERARMDKESTDGSDKELQQHCQ